MKIRDWVIVQGRTGYHLHHSKEACSLVKNGLNKADPSFYGWYAYVTPKGVWQCPCCYAIAPDEIAFVAELAGCPRNHNEFVSRVKDYERKNHRRI